LTYQELNARANQLANQLRENGAGPETRVGVCVGRSIEMIVAMLGVLKAGGAYVPMDPTHPRERLAFMLTDAQTNLLLTEQRLLPGLPAENKSVICLDSNWDLIARQSPENLSNIATPDGLAYVIYTSGSTGRPKGVAVPHRAVNRLALNTDYIQISGKD